MYRFLVIILCVINTVSHAQSPVARALAGSAVAVHDSAFAPIAQASSSGLEENFFIAVSAEPGRFGLKELSTYSFACSRGFSTYALGFGIVHSGDALYNENRFALSASFVAPGDVRFGVTINLHNHAILGYGKTSAYSLDFSVAAPLSASLDWAALMTNSTSSSLGEGERLPSKFSSGFLFHATEQISFVSGLTKELDAPFDASLGIIYSPYKIFSARFGAALVPSCVGCGISVDATIMTIDYGIDRHSVLGFTHSFAVSVKL